jgi:hypothetical protein
LPTDRPSAEHDQPPRHFAQIPDVFQIQELDLIQSIDRRHERLRAGGNDDRTSADRFAIDFHGPRCGDLCVAAAHVDAKTAVALG